MGKIVPFSFILSAHHNIFPLFHSVSLHIIILKYFTFFFSVASSCLDFALFPLLLQEKLDLKNRDNARPYIFFKYKFEITRFEVYVD